MGSSLIVCFLFIGFFQGLFFSVKAFGGGDGSVGNPYQITNCTDFQGISGNLGAHYIIQNDFTCSSVTSWGSLGTFTGVLDGNGKTISDFTGTNIQGIFTSLSGATVKNLTIANVQFSSPGNEFVGALAGSAYDSSSILNVHISSGTIVGYHTVGGLLGNMEPGTLSDSSASVSVTGVNFVGGLVGRLIDTVVDSCYATGNVSSTGNPTGGLIGYSTGAISNSYATGNVIENNPSASDQWATGGLAGYASGGITNSYATGKVDSYWEAGGLVGWVENMPVSKCYATGNVGSIITTGTRIGGFVGAGLADISNSFATGNVTGSDAVGGFAGGFGWGGRTLSYSYSKGLVTGSTNVGGFVGDIQGTVSDSYYDQQTSGHSDTGKGIPENTSAMKIQGTYSGWDFSTIWSIDGSVNNGYPINYVPAGVSHNATVVSSSYTVSAGGTSNETITNVPFGTSKVTFLAALSKGNANQTWDSSSVSNPVVSNNTLVVTAEDGTTVVTYTISVNAEGSHVATVTSSAYTVSAGGTANETITNVLANTSKSEFLSNLSKGETNQTWNDSDLSNPIEYGDTLIVTAQDGATSVTYTLVAPVFSGAGLGTISSPYVITNCSQLQEIRYYLSSYFSLNQDINCSATSTWNSGDGFIPIGVSPSNPFVGMLEGNGFTISGLTINKPSVVGGYVGLFGAIDDGVVIENISLSNVSITASTYSNVGALAGAIGFSNASGSSTLNNIHITSGNVHGNLNVGGLLGSSAYDLANSSASVTVVGNASVGGLIGEMMGDITRSSSTGNVTSNNVAAGGLVGTASGSISDSYAKGNVSVTGYEGGGLVGLFTVSSSHYATIERSYATGNVTGDDDIAGFIGFMTGWGTKSKSAALVKNCYATGNITESQLNRDGYYIGGFVGEIDNGTIENSYSTGAIDSGTPSESTGGFCGKIDSSETAIISNSFWNMETAGYTTSAGGTGKTTAEMKTLATYTAAGWDFDSVWNINSSINNGYPFFGFAGLGYGTESSPYEITDCKLLQGMSYNLGAYYILKNNIDCSATSTWNSGRGFVPIGNSVSNPFVGSLDGDGHTITGLTINSNIADDIYVGLFGVLGNHSYVGNINLADVDITSTDGTAVGSIAGTFGSCENNGTINILGSAEMENINVLSGNVSGNEKVGGLVGISCYNLHDSSSSVNVSGSYLRVGGLVGENCGDINNSYSTGSVTGNELVGGLIGQNYGDVLDSYASGNVIADSQAGGLIGDLIAYANSTIAVDRSYATGSVTGDDLIGGLVGEAISFLNPGADTILIRNCYANGNVIENDAYRDGIGIAGLVGRFANGTIENSYSASVVNSGSPETTSGGLVGIYETTYTKIVNSFWDMETSGYTTGAGGTGKTTTEMRTLTTYTDVNWDFTTIWSIHPNVNRGYPINYIYSIVYTPVSITDLNTSMSVIDTSSSLDATIPSEVFKGAGRNIKLYFGSGLTKKVIANIVTDLTASRSWANVEGILNLTSKKVLVHNLASAPGAASKYDMYVPKGVDDNRVLVCPNATTLSAVAFGCTDGYILTSNQMTSSVISGSAYWIISDLTGTGAMSYKYTPEEEPPVVTQDDQEVIDNTETPPKQETVLDELIGDISNNDSNRTTLKEVVAVLATSITTVSKQINNTIKELPISQDVSQKISAVSLAVVVISPAVSVGIGSSYAMVYMTRFISVLLALLGLGRKKRNCGLVYDSVTKEPLPNAIVRIYSSEGTLIATEITNMYGIFESSIKSGQYNIVVQANNYLFPSRLISGIQDLPYNNIYNGGNFYYDSSSALGYSIPVDHVNKSLAEYAGAIARNRVIKWSSIIINILVLAGLAFSIISYVKLNSLLNLILLIVYMVILLIGMIMKRQELYKFGMVRDFMGNPKEGVQIGLLETEFNTVYAKRVTNEKGKYRFMVPGGNYKLVSLDPYYDLQSGEEAIFNGKGSKMMVISENIVIVKKI